MKRTFHLAGLRISGAATRAVTLLSVLLCFLSVPRLAAQDAPLPELQTAEQVRQLTPEQAARHYPVRLRGVLTFFDQAQFYRFFQDGTAGIYLFPSDALTNSALATGELVEIEGLTSPGEYAPTVTPQRTRILGSGTFPPAKPVSYEDLASGEFFDPRRQWNRPPHLRARALGGVHDLKRRLIEHPVIVRLQADSYVLAFHYPCSLSRPRCP